MEVQLESTTKIVDLNGVPARIWEGQTENGIAVHAFIARIAVHNSDDATQFEAELKECRAPTNPDINTYPARLML